MSSFGDIAGMSNLYKLKTPDSETKPSESEFQFYYLLAM